VRCLRDTGAADAGGILHIADRLVDGPLTGNRDFVDAFVELVAEMPEILRGAPSGPLASGRLNHRTANVAISVPVMFATSG